MPQLNLRLTLKQPPRPQTAECEMEITPAQAQELDTIFAFVGAGLPVKVDMEFDDETGALSIALRPQPGSAGQVMRCSMFSSQQEMIAAIEKLPEEPPLREDFKDVPEGFCRRVGPNTTFYCFRDGTHAQVIGRSVEKGKTIWGGYIKFDGL